MINFERIEQYLNQELSPEEMAAFRTEMEANPELAQEVKFQQFEEGALDWLVEKNLRDKVTNYRKAFLEKETPVLEVAKETTPAPSRSNSLWIIGIAASVALIIGFFTLMPGNAGPTVEQIADGLYADYPFSSANRMKSGNVTSSEDKGTLEQNIAALEQGQFETAVSYFSTITPEDDNYLTAQYFLGHTYFKQADYAAAKQQFQLIIQTPQPDISDRLLEDAQFYLFVTYLKEGQVDAAKELATKASDRYAPVMQKAIKEIAK